jgi:hypothetical protein
LAQAASLVVGEPGTEADPVLMGVLDPAARDRLIVPLHSVVNSNPAVSAGQFDIVLG